MDWTWAGKIKGFISKVLDKVLGKKEILPIEKANTARGEALVTRITEGLISGQTSVGTWERQMREALKTTYIQNYLLGIGGQGQLSAKDFGSIGGMLGEQYKYLSNFAQQIADEKLTEAQIQARAAMYARSAREGFFRADARAWGIIDGKLPAYPGDGSTRCLCITTPKSRVLTSVGWKMLSEVIVGDFVLTHLLRWRKVTGKIVKPSLPGMRQMYMRSKDGEWVGVTDTHRFFTEDGWQDAMSIYNNYSMVYNLGIPKEAEYAQKILPELRLTSIQQVKAESVPGLPAPISMFLREAERSSGQEMSFLREQGRSQWTMGKGSINSRIEEVSQSAPENIREVDFRGLYLPEDRRQAFQLLLGERKEAVHLPLSMDLDDHQWPYTDRLRITPQERDKVGRFAGQSGTKNKKFSCEASRGKDTFEDVGKVSYQDLCSLWKDIPETSEKRSTGEILLGDLLPVGSALFDLQVEEDHSFIIENLVSHNTNCGCSWEFEDSLDERGNVIGVDCYWIVNPAMENCEDCLENMSTWNPFTVEM